MRKMDSMQQLSPEHVVENYEKFANFARATGEHRRKEIDAFLDHFGERLAVCPASSRLDFHEARTGGLVNHSLRVLTNAMKLAKLQESKDPKESIMFAALFHDIGKVGDLEHERYVPQTEEYWRKRGNVYQVNDKMPFMTVTDNSTFILQHFGVRMTWNEYSAIRLADGHFEESNSAYKMKEPDLAVLIHTADLWATRWEKQNLI